MTIFLHIGTHKTGTTTLQRFARKNEQVLAKSGCLYPDYNLIGKKGHYAHHHIAHALAEDENNRLSEKAAKRFIQKVVELSSEYESVLISAEPLYRHYLGQLPVSIDRMAYWDARKQYISKVRDCFGKAEVQIVMTIRQQAGFAMSLYQENIKVRRYSKPFSVFLDEHWYYFEYLKQAEMWKEFFGSVRLLAFESLTKGGKLVENFFKSLDNINIENCIFPERTNESLCPDFLEFKRMMNQTSFSLNELRSLRYFLEENSASWFSEQGKKKKIVVEAETLNKFQASFLEENNKLARIYCGQEESVLPVKRYSAGEEYGELKPEQAFEIFARYAKSLSD